jgi:hypothetical protein
VTWRDAIFLVGRELRRRAGRAALTVAAVALAATLLTALVTIAGTAQNRVLSQVTTGGPLASIKVVAAEPDPSQVDRDNARPGPPKPLDESALARIRNLRDVQAAYPVLAVPVAVLAPLRVAVPGVTQTVVTAPGQAPARPVPGVGPDEPFGDSLVGVPVAQSAHLPLTSLAGRLPVPGSLTEVAVTPEFLDRLHIPQNQARAILGATVEFGFPRGFGPTGTRAWWVHPTVVGVVAQDAGAGEFVGSIELAALGRDWTLSGEADTASRFGLQATTYTGVFVIADRLDRVATLRNRITAVGYSTSAAEQLIASVKRYLRVVEIVLTAVGLIAFLVAALGITNALLAAVRERRREIGVLKAVGARDRDILRLFLVEAAVVGSLGGTIGAALGTSIAALVGLAVNRYLASQGVAPLHLAVSVAVLVGAVAGSALLAVVAGVLPARRAARLSASEAVAAA